MKKFLKKIVELLFPNQCLSCSCLIGIEGAFCNQCWQKLQFITDPKCKICSHPFEFQVDDALVCARCLNHQPPYNKAVSLFAYNHAIKKIIGDFKYRDNTYLAKKLARMMFHRCAPMIADVDLIICVPLHKKRLSQRKFNQALLLTKALSKLSGKAFAYDYLIRTRNTTAQAGLRRKEREKNVKNAFMLNEKYAQDVVGKKILLLDDVITTGATLEHCSKVLKKSGAKEVVLLVIAKTIFK